MRQGRGADMHQRAIFEDEQEARIVQQQQQAAQREQRVAVFVILQSVVPWLEMKQASWSRRPTTA